MKKVKWGIVGPGIIAKEFAHDFQFVNHGELSAVASNNSERGKAFADKFDIPIVHTSYEDLYNDPNVNAVYVATPHTFHLKNAADALKAGKAVLCEKPITVNPSELEELLSIAHNSNQYLIEGMWTYFLPVIQKAQEWVNEGRIGRILHIKSDFGYPVPFDAKSRMYNPDLAGGALLDMGIYNVAMAWLFLGQDPKKAEVLGRQASTGVFDDVTTLFEYESAAANLTTSFRCKLNNWAYIIGEEGYIAIPDFWRARECDLYKVEECVDHFKDDRKGFGFNYEIDAVSKDILAGKKESDVVPHATSKKLQQHMQMIADYY